jgi:trimethylamine--corrinoid protein Co-methyltransferase
MTQRRSRRGGGRAARQTADAIAKATDVAFNGRGVESGALRGLSDATKDRVHAGALEILESVGFGEAPDHTRDILVAAGCSVSEQGRILFPRSLVEDTIATAASSLVLHGQRPEHDLEVSGSRAYFSTGCGSVRVVDPHTRSVRPTTVADVYDFARLVDTLDNIHMFHRLGIPNDIDSTDDVDINLCYACVRGTSKPVSSSWFNGENVSRSIEMMHHIAGGEAKWRARPFVLNTCTFVVPPLKFSPESCIGLENSIRGGMPVQLTSSGQQGATAPVTAAGTVVQTMAEVLGGLVYAYAVSPDARVILGTWPLVSDLRTGAATTGSAEQAIVSSAACQMARYYDLPNGCVSGITDSKLPDAQSGFEKGIQHAITGHSGGNIMFCAAGALAGGLGCSHAGVVIDNEIIGAVLRTVDGIDIGGADMAVEMIREVCLEGPGHYLGHDETLKRMKTDFFYPTVSDRRGMNDWLSSGTPSILENADNKAREILSTHHPKHVPDDIDQALRDRFNILLSPNACQPAA